MIVEKQRLEGATLLRLEGAIKLGESAAFFGETLNRVLADEKGDVLVDFSRIDYMDSTGIGELVGYLGRAGAERRKLILINPSEKIRKLLQVARLDSLFTFRETVEAALAG
jgi:anti-sigma B factor antagonist